MRTTRLAGHTQICGSGGNSLHSESLFCCTVFCVRHLRESFRKWAWLWWVSVHFSEDRQEGCRKAECSQPQGSGETVCRIKALAPYLGQNLSQEVPMTSEGGPGMHASLCGSRCRKLDQQIKSRPLGRWPRLKPARQEPVSSLNLPLPRFFHL